MNIDIITDTLHYGTLGNMRRLHVLKETTSDARTYKMAQNSLVSGCPICAPHRGCNRWKSDRQRTWKKFRKTKWK